MWYLFTVLTGGKEALSSSPYTVISTLKITTSSILMMIGEMEAGNNKKREGVRLKRVAGCVMTTGSNTFQRGY